MRVLYMCGRAGFTLKQQEKILAPLPGDKVYIEGRGAETFEAALKACRGIQVLEVAGGFRPLGDSISMVLENLEPLDRLGKVVFDPMSSRRSDKNYAAMCRGYLASLRGESSIGDRAPHIGKLGGMALAKKRRERRMPEKQAKKIWLDRRHIRNRDALLLMDGWTEPTAYSRLGKPKRKPGRK